MSRSVSRHRKYRLRPSPPHPANDAKWKGKTRVKGNDGHFYDSKPDVRGVHRWVKCPVRRRRSAKRRHVRSRRTPLRRSARRASQLHGSPLRLTFRMKILDGTSTDPDAILKAHLRMAKNDIASFANTVASEYLPYPQDYVMFDMKPRAPFALVRPRVQGRSVVLTPTRHLSASDIKAFRDVFDDKFSGYVRLDGVFGSLSLVG